MKVSEFRAMTEHLERVVNVDRHACVGPAEKAKWVDVARRIGDELVKAHCARATASDLSARKAAVEACADAVAANLGWAPDWHRAQ